MSQFAFLQSEFAEVFESANRAEALANSDPRAACFYARRALDLAVTWAYGHDSSFQLQDVRLACAASGGSLLKQSESRKAAFSPVSNGC